MRRTLILAGLAAGIVALSAWTPVGRSELEAAPPSISLENVLLATEDGNCVGSAVWSESPRGKPVFVQMRLDVETSPGNFTMAFNMSFQEQEKTGQISQSLVPAGNAEGEERLTVTLRDNKGFPIAPPMTETGDFC